MKPDLIFSADWHLRLDTPTCWTGNFLESQAEAITFVVDKAKKYKCPIVIVGDLGHRALWENKLERMFIELTKGVKIFVIAGQHDLVNHQLSKWRDGGIGVLHEAEAIKMINTIESNFSYELYPFHYGMKLKSYRNTKQGPRIIALPHQMVIEDNPLWPGQEASTGNKLLKSFPIYDLIVTGDNHLPFVAKQGRRLLVNCGSLQRQTAAQIDHRPRVYLWEAESNTVNPVYLPYNEKAVSRKHIKQVEDRDQRMEAFISHVSSDYEISLSVKNNLKKFFESNRIQKRVKQKVYEAIGGE